MSFREEVKMIDNQVEEDMLKLSMKSLNPTDKSKTYL